MLRMGQIKMMPKTLKSKCTKATVTAASLPVIRAANIAVRVVPTFAPSVKGKICRRVRMPAPASGTTKEVVIELL